MWFKGELLLPVTGRPSAPGCSQISCSPCRSSCMLAIWWWWRQPSSFSPPPPFPPSWMFLSVSSPLEQTPLKRNTVTHSGWLWPQVKNRHGLCTSTAGPRWFLLTEITCRFFVHHHWPVGGVAKLPDTREDKGGLQCWCWQLWRWGLLLRGGLSEFSFSWWSDNFTADVKGTVTTTISNYVTSPTEMFKSSAGKWVTLLSILCKNNFSIDNSVVQRPWSRCFQWFT